MASATKTVIRLANAATAARARVVMPTQTAATAATAQTTAPSPAPCLGSTPASPPPTAPWRKPVPADSVAVFRIAFGLLVTFSSLRFLAKGWVDALYLEPTNHLTYRWFGWVAPLPAPWMHLMLVALAVLGICIALGYRHRLATVLFILLFAYTELIEAALYLNHYWFVTLAAVLLLVLPVQHRWSLDAVAGRVRPCTWTPAGVVWALRAQVGLVYVFAGLAKLNPDWLFEAQPLKLWLADRTHLAIIGPYLDEPLVAYLASWGGALFDCTIVGWLLWRKSRPWAYGVLVVFHVATWLLFQIGVFPWVMIAATLVFFSPDWPTKLMRQMRQAWQMQHRPKLAGLAAPLATAATTAPASSTTPAPTTPRLKKPALALLIALAVMQIALPLRHYIHHSNVRWSEEGYYLSWRVMLTEKAGYLRYQVQHPASGQSWQANPELVLTDWQASYAATRPDLIHATALLLTEHYAQQGIHNIEVYADSWAAMNGRPAQRLVNPTVNLAAYGRGQLPAGWIMELQS